MIGIIQVVNRAGLIYGSRLGRKIESLCNLKLSIVWLSLGAIAINISARADSVNLLVNPSFESGSGTAAAGWGNFNPASGTTDRTAAFAHDGSYSFRFSSAGYTEFPHSNSTAIAAAAGTMFDVSMWGLYDTFDPLDSTHNADCKATFYDASGDQLNFTESYFLTAADPADTWKRADFTLTAPTNTACLIMQIGVADTAQSTSHAAVYFDDGSVTVVSAPCPSPFWAIPILFGFCMIYSKTRRKVLTEGTPCGR